MTRLVSLLILVLLIASAATLLEAASVRGYTRRDGTYVQPYQRTNPDQNPYNNYGFPGNYNPNTGKITGGDQQRYLDRYPSGQSGFGGSGTYPNSFDR